MSTSVSALIGILILLLGLLLFVALLAVLAVFVFWRVRVGQRRRQALAEEEVAPAEPALPKPAPKWQDEDTEREPTPDAPGTVEPGALIGFFDDERHAPPPRAPQDAALTELFQRGAQAYEWDDDSDEEEGATEVFSAHHDEEFGDFSIED